MNATALDLRRHQEDWFDVFLDEHPQVDAAVRDAIPDDATCFYVTALNVSEGRVAVSYDYWLPKEYEGQRPCAVGYVCLNGDESVFHTWEGSYRRANQRRRHGTVTVST